MTMHEQPLLLSPYVAPVLAGVLSHAVCHRLPPASLGAFAAVAIGPPLLLTAVLSPPGASTLITYYLRSVAIYLTTLFTSIALYRLSPFHPLAKYPGPWQAKVSRFWALKKVVGKHQNLTSHKLFEQYGDVVRTGPNHLIFRDPAAIPVILGPKNAWPKGARYDVAKHDGSTGSVLSTIDPAEHNKRRRVWDRAFTPTALKSYQPMLQNRVAQLVTALDARSGKEIDLAEWLAYMALDFMGDFAYGGMFNFMRDGDPEGFRHMGEKFTFVGELLGSISWIKPVVLALPRATGPLLDTGVRVAKQRQAEGSSHGKKDLFYYLLDEDGESGHPPMGISQLAQEAGLAIVAGSDTTGTAMANAFFYFMETPSVYTRLRAELDAAASEGTDGMAAYDIEIEENKLSTLPYLNAIINETIRLQPAVPNGVQRIPPPEGGPVVVAGHVVPVGTTCQIPKWSLHRDLRNFSPNPHGFWPERWMPEGPKLAEARGEEFKLNTHAYIPFNYGPGNCVGRNLALGELRAVLAALVRRYDIRFADGFRPEEFTENLRDTYILVRGRLQAVVTKRV